MQKVEKEKLIQDVHGKFAKSNTAFVMNYKGVDVVGMTEFRRKLKAIDAEFKVVKNSLVGLAVKNTSFELLKDGLKGQNGIAFVYKDPAAAAKVIADFMKSHETMSMTSGVLAGKRISGKDLIVLSDLPSREVLLARLAGSLNAPVTKFASVTAALLRQLPNVLNAIKEKKQ